LIGGIDDDIDPSISDVGMRRPAVGREIPLYGMFSAQIYEGASDMAPQGIVQMV
jgi:hypothetical protein